EINAAPATSGWTNPTVVYVDSITVNTATPLSFPFDSTSTVNTATNVTSDPTNTNLWMNSGSTDTTATGTAASWQATCP
ncbi:MAG TPA: hypothetical protein VGQ57_04580, partial [Polyangiaceae bacterium]|nr:hypothetical protein [Polyangiaceae bacterium]